FQFLLNQSIMSDEEDPYAVSSDSEDEKPRKKIEIGAKVDLSSLKKGLAETKEVSSTAKEELEALSANKKEEMEQMKKDFEEGTVKKEEEEENEVKKAKREEREKLTQIGKEKYSKFKDKFENIETTMGENLEDRLKSLVNEKELELIEKGQLKSAKERFEKGESDREIQKEKIEVARNEEDKKRILSTFNRGVKQEMTADEAPKECAICSKTVYPVERVFVNKKLYHKDCFKCETCNKKLTATNYNCHEGAILCKVHLMAKKHPEMAATLDPANTEEEEHEEEDEAFAVSSKPKKLAGDVVRCGGTTTEEELAALRGLGGKKKEEWEKEAIETEKAEKSAFDAGEIGEGRVKANKERFLTGGGNEDEEEEEEGERDPNIIRGDRKKKKEDLHFEQVGDLKNKWKTGEVETAEQKEAEGKAELEALKAGGVSVKERFQEGKEVGGDVKKWDRSMLDTSSAAEARKSFIEGRAFETTKDEGKGMSELGELQFSKLKDFKERFEAAGNAETKEELERLAIDVAIDLGNLKTAFLKSDEMSPEERAALKKKEIEAEFIRYKLARRAAVQRANDAGEAASVSTAGVGDVKAAFDSGEAFKGGAGEKGGLDVDVKMAGKAREKFQQIDAAGAAPVMPGQNKKTEPSKWDKKEASTAEVINRRAVDKENTPEDDEDAFDVKNLMNKFKNIGNDDGKKIDNAARAELEALKSGAKDAKSRFEKGGDEDNEKDEEKKKAMQEEFDRLRREREEAKKQLEEELLEEERNRCNDKEEVGVAAAHASKMAAKWEKINAKEAKKAEKGKMPEKKTVKWSMAEVPRCPLCSDRVYSAEMVHCFGKPFHSKCFRCLTCKQALRMVSARTDGSNLYCQRHSTNTGLSRCQA
ncbi:hypothetical protein PFISCL1PPCAC_14880, partial [Pristionchus fissidentatus]